MKIQAGKWYKVAGSGIPHMAYEMPGTDEMPPHFQLQAPWPAGAKPIAVHEYGYALALPGGPKVVESEFEPHTLQIKEGCKYITTEGYIGLAKVANTPGRYGLHLKNGNGMPYLVDSAGYSTLGGPKLVLCEVPTPLRIEAGKWYACAEQGDTPFQALSTPGGNFSLESGKCQLALVTLEGICVDTKRQIVLREIAAPADTPLQMQRAICTYTVLAKVVVQIGVEYDADTKVVDLQADAERLARANLPKGVEIVEVQGLDIKL